MSKDRITTLFLFAVLSYLNAQPEVTSWTLNCDGTTGYGNILANVQAIHYKDDYVYVSSTGIPDYDIGPWPGNPNTPSNQSYIFKISRYPHENSGDHFETPLGPIGVLINGVPFFNAKDAFSYQGEGVWFQNAVMYEAESFDDCLCHPAPMGNLHNHQNPVCLYEDIPGEHSPLVGFAFDGFPVYGPRGYANTDGTGDNVRMETGYQVRDITDRSTLPDGTELPQWQWGPPISSVPLGWYIEDYEYVEELGHLDEYNGRFAVTPEYPDGTYAYYVTIHVDGSSAFPYIIGPEYYGEPEMDNIGPWSNVTIPGDAVEFTCDSMFVSYSAEVVPEKLKLYPNYPNPFNPTTTIRFDIPYGETYDDASLQIYDITGRLVGTLMNDKAVGGEYEIKWNAGDLSSGVYMVQLKSGDRTVTQKLTLFK